MNFAYGIQPSLPQPERKFVGKADTDEWEIMTDNGWKDVKTVGKTIPYEVWEVWTDGNKLLRCADTHILYDEEWDEIYACRLNTQTRPDMVQTADGEEMVEVAFNTHEKENMYDIEVDDVDHRYYANGFVSHNSIFLCNDATTFCRMGKNVIYITCEMSDRKIIKRIGANMLDIELKDYNRIASDQRLMFDKIQAFRSKQLTPLGRLFVKEYPTGSATVIDIENYMKKIQEKHGIKIDVLVIDYINIMRNYRCSDASNTYIYIKTLAEDLRGLAVKHELLVITATQINRSGFDTSDITVANMSESTGLLNTADQGYGIIQDATMRASKTYNLKILKIRDGYGKNHKMVLSIDYKKMRLVEEGTVYDENGEEVMDTRGSTRETASATRSFNPATDGGKTIAERFNPSDNGFGLPSGSGAGSKKQDTVSEAPKVSEKVDINNLDF